AGVGGLQSSSPSIHARFSPTDVYRYPAAVTRCAGVFPSRIWATLFFFAMFSVGFRATSQRILLSFKAGVLFLPRSLLASSRIIFSSSLNLTVGLSSSFFSSAASVRETTSNNQGSTSRVRVMVSLGTTDRNRRTGRVKQCSRFAPAERVLAPGEEVC